MFKFLFGGPKGAEAAVKIETQRQTLERLVGELNDVLTTMPEKPGIAIDMNGGSIALNLPEQLADEAIALPAPGNPVVETTEQVGTTEAGTPSDQAANDAAADKTEKAA